jgi:competence ComEA-like helix-hairpin-helix protein
MPIIEFSKAQMKMLTLLGITVLTAGSFTLVRDFYLPPPDRGRLWTAESLDQYRPTLVLDLNLSPADSLELVPGIGPTLARRIIEYRQSRGNFVAIDSLINVTGIGPVTLQKIKRYFKVSHR